jgi:hypothetical protein
LIAALPKSELVAAERLLAYIGDMADPVQTSSRQILAANA